MSSPCTEWNIMSIGTTPDATIHPSINTSAGKKIELLSDRNKGVLRTPDNLATCSVDQRWLLTWWTTDNASERGRTPVDVAIPTARSRGVIDEVGVIVLV